ncbi:MAG: 50S ribosomal protein L9 [Finegoldia magna]|uniref:Large ribosomal subunit protein bL9 n=1 Tax=Finegoldia magna TaxID=1260 RepID=A0A7D4FM73_FINMA|nr:50S ribosomal protein L9 [Finegoldia magna]EGS32998.1 ribosomal protein L9 [Finegoldia magna SY403409CC001050417]MBS5776793.1 50S ribosomal protein L9 [Finegoldia magna]MDU2575507.1 50S ribosomal protein L9 [Finegoldia magna]MDU2639234.1 50S ribosomal protein L9 [Finegoldia magna]MDU5442286.1 50S ribosomal protein L9 [Finegoldia magna]
MKVILTSDVDKLGKAGEMVNAKTGFARNFLLPNKLAVQATKENIKIWEEKQAELRAIERENIKNANELKEKIENTKVKIIAKTGEGDRLFGSITSMDIEKALKDQHGLDVDKKKIEMKDNIKSLGTFNVVVKVYPDINANLEVIVDKE